MKISVKISLYLIGVIIFLSSIIKYFDYRHSSMVELYISDMLKQKEKLLIAVKELNSFNAQKNVEDYTLWDEMVDFVHNRDQEWGDANLAGMTALLKLNFIKVYNTECNNFYSTYNQMKPFNLSLDDKQIKEMFKNDSIVHFYQIVGGDLLEIFGATIHPVTDIERKTTTAGYYFSGVIWNDAYKARIENMLDGKIMIVTDKDHLYLPSGSEKTFSETVVDPFTKSKIAEIVVVYDLNKLANLSLFSRTYLGVVISFLLLFVIFTYLVFRSWILKPLELISLALFKQTPQILAKYEKKNDEFGYITKIVMNFFEQKKKLSESEELFRKSFEDTPIGMALVGTDSRIVKFNNAFCEMFGYHDKEVMVMTYHDLIFQTELQRVNNVVDQLKSSAENSLVTEICFKHRNGDQVWGIVNIALIRDSEGEAKYYICQIQNITDRKAMEQNLEEIVLRRTKDLLQLNKDLKNTLDELYKSQELIVKQEKLASLGTMLAGIAHEINNPAQAIKFSLEALDLNLQDIKRFLDEVLQLKNLPIEEKLDKMSVIESVIDYLDLDTVLAEVLNFTKLNKDSVNRIENIVMSTKRMAYKDSGFSLVCMNEVLKDSLVLVENQLKYSVRTEILLDDRLPNIRGLSQELGQVFINVLINSRDAVVEKGLSKEDAVIRISSFYEKSSEQSCMIFEDNGVGIKKENLVKMFDPFFTTKAPGKGTGLGMNIVHRIVNLHNGKIEVFSSVGKGTVIAIKIPAARL